MRREKWEPTEHSWLCSAHFVSESKSNDRLQTMCQVFLATPKALGSVKQSTIYKPLPEGKKLEREDQMPQVEK